MYASPQPTARSTIFFSSYNASADLLTAKPNTSSDALYSYFSFWVNGFDSLTRALTHWKSFPTNSLNSPFPLRYVSISLNTSIVFEEDASPHHSLFVCNETTTSTIIVNAIKSYSNTSVWCRDHQWSVVRGTLCVDCFSSRCPTHTSAAVVPSLSCISPRGPKMWAILTIASQLVTANTVPSIAKLDLVMRQNSADILVKLDPPNLSGRVYCAPYLNGLSPASTSAVKASGSFSSLSESNGAELRTTVRVYGLLALTTYDFYCLTEDLLGNSASLFSVLATRVTNKTICCRKIIFSNAPSLIYSNRSDYIASSPDTYSYTYYLTALPDESTSITITPVLYLSGQKVSNAVIRPTYAVFDANSDPTLLFSSFIISGVFEGRYSLNLSLSGSASLQYSGSQCTLVVLPSSTASLPVPELSFAVFANSGRSVSIFFDSATDQARRYKLSTPWNCALLLSFAGANVSTCSWTNSSAIITFFPFLKTESNIVLLEPGDVIATVPGKIRAYCSKNVDCSYANDDASSYVIAQAPSDAVFPTAVLVTPSVFIPCSNLTLDATASVGHGGRPWKTISWLVTGTNNSEASAMTAYLNMLSLRGISVPLEVPVSLLNSTSFTFQLKLKNFFGATDSIASIVSIVSPNHVNYAYEDDLKVVIAGTSFRSVKRSDPLSMQAYVLSTGCSSITSLSYSWTIYKNYELVVGLTSSSSDPRKLLLPAYSLASGDTYQMVVTLTSREGSSSKAVATVYVLPSLIFAAIVGGRRREVSTFNHLTLDASSSADEDVPTSSSSLSPGLIFRWTCLLVDFIHYGESCGLSMNTNSSLLYIKAGALIPKSTHRFIVTVYSSDRRRYSQAFTDIYSVMIIMPIVQITSTFRLFNPSDKLRIDAVFSSNISVVSAWSGFFGDSSSPIDFQLDGGNTTLTSTTRTFSTNANTSLVSVPFPISFAHGVFSSGSTLTFRVTVIPLFPLPSLSIAYAEVQVTAHAPPTSGSIIVIPMFGYELQTQFTLSAPQWTTEPDSYPLHYEFLCLLDLSDAPLSLNSPSELSYLSARLPSGWDSNGYVVTALVRVTDLYSGLSEATTTVRVESKTSTSNILMILQSSLDTAFASFDVSTVYQLLGGIASHVSASNCTLAPDCSDIGRENCKMTSHTCGSCLSDYVGVVGDSNIPCHPRTPTYHSNCSTCLYGTCVHGVCVIPSKSCLGRDCATKACSGHGFCQYVSIIDRSILQQCLVTDTGCEAECVCDSDYGGIDCSKTITQLNELRYIRQLVCLSLKNLTAIQDASSQLVLAESAVLRKVVDGSELDAAGAVQCASAVEQMATYAAEGHLDNADIAQQLIMDTLSSVVKMCYDFRILSDRIATIISALIEGVQRGMSPGQFSSAIISNYVRTTVHYDTLTYLHGLTWQPPASEADIAYGVSIPSITMPRSGLDACGISEYYAQMSLTQWIANPHGNAAELKSSLLRYSSSTTNTTLRPSAFESINRNTSFYIYLLFGTAQNWTTKAPGCELFTNNQRAPCKCRALKYGPHNVTFQCWDMSLLCPIAPKSNHFALGNHMSHAGNRRLDFDFQGSETSSSSYTDTTKSEDIGAFVAALGKEVPATLMQSPSFEEALPAFLLVSGLAFVFILGYIFLLRWDVLDRQQIIYAAADREKNDEDANGKLKSILIQGSQGSIADRFSFSVRFGRTSSDANTQTLRERFDLRKYFFNMGIATSTSRNSLEGPSSSKSMRRRTRDKLPARVKHEKSTNSANSSPIFPAQTENAGIEAFYDFEENPDVRTNDIVEDTKNEHKPNNESGMKVKIDNQLLSSKRAKSLQLDDDGFRNLLPDFIADHLTKRLLQTRGIVRRFLKVLLRDHDWIRIFTYKSRRMTRTIRFMIVCTDLLALLFMDSLFYGVLFPSNSSTCVDYSAESGGTSDQCLGQRSLWQGRDLCVWSDDEQTCDANPPPTNFEFFIIVTMLVSIFSTPFQVVMRYILTEVVSKETDLRRVTEAITSCFGLFAAISWCVSQPRSYEGGNPSNNKDTKLNSAVDNAIRGRYSSSTLSARALEPGDPYSAWRNKIMMLYSYSDLLTAKEEIELLLCRVRNALTRELQVAPFPWDLEANISAGEHKARMDAIMSYLHLYADGTPMPMTWWQYLRHGSPIRHLEWKLGLIRKREKIVLGYVREATTTDDKDAALLKHFILEQLPPFERYAVSRKMSTILLHKFVLFFS